MTVARRRAVDHLRRRERLDRKHDQLGHELEVRRGMEAPDPGDVIGDPVGDDVLRLMFMCCHPLLSREARVTLTLRLPGGLTTQEVGNGLGRYALQAAIAACHARAASPEETDWEAIAALYDALAQVAPSPVVELNRAVAVGRAFGSAVGLEIVDGLVEDDALEGYHLLPTVRGYLLARLGRAREARTAFERAAALAGNDREREVLLRRAAEAGAG